MSAQFAPNVPSGAEAPCLWADCTAGLKPRLFKAEAHALKTKSDILRPRP